MVPGSLDAGYGAALPSPRIASSRGVAAAISALRRLPHIVWVWVTRAEARRGLSMLSDHVLRDIGMTRADVERELLKPFWRE